MALIGGLGFIYEYRRRKRAKSKIGKENLSYPTFLFYNKLKTRETNLKKLIIMYFPTCYWPMI